MKAIRLVALVFVFAHSTSFAQASLTLVPGVRSIGMGETGGADVSDPLNAVFNPAILAFHEGTQLNIFYNEAFSIFSDDVRLKGGQVSVGKRFETSSGGKVALAGALNYTKLSFGETTVVDFTGVQLGTYDPFERHFSISAAVGLELEYFMLAVGSSIKPWKAEVAPVPFSPIAPQKGDANAVDFGLLAGHPFGDQSAWNGRVTGGFAVVNTGSDVSTDVGELALPRYNNYALSGTLSSPLRELLDVDVPSVQGTLNIDIMDFDAGGTKVAYRVGAEVGVVKMAFLRLGWIKEQDADTSALLAGFSAGVTMGWGSAYFDYATVPLDILGSNVDVGNRDHKYGIRVAASLP